MKITVTMAHIAKAEPDCAYRCPIALALLDAGLIDVMVELDGMCGYDRNGNSWKDGLTDEAKTFVTRFDDGKPVEPFSFEIEVP